MSDQHSPSSGSGDPRSGHPAAEDHRLCVAALARVPPRRMLKITASVAGGLLGVLGAAASVIAVLGYRVSVADGSHIALGLAGASWFALGGIVTAWQFVHHFRAETTSNLDWVRRRVGLGASLGWMGFAAPFMLLLLVAPQSVTGDYLWTWLLASAFAFSVWIVLEMEHHRHAEPGTPPSPVRVSPVLPVVVIVLLLAALAIDVAQEPPTIRILESAPTEQSPDASDTTVESGTATTLATAASEPPRSDDGQATTSPPPTTSPCPVAPGEGVTDAETALRMNDASVAGAAPDWLCVAGPGEFVTEGCWVQRFESGRAVLVGREHAAAVVGDAYVAPLAADLGENLCAVGATPLNRMDLPDGRRDLIAVVNDAGEVVALYGRRAKADVPTRVAPELLTAYCAAAVSGTVLSPVNVPSVGADGQLRQEFADAADVIVALTPSAAPCDLMIIDLYALAFGVAGEDVPRWFRVP